MDTINPCHHIPISLLAPLVVLAKIKRLVVFSRLEIKFPEKA